MNNNSGKSVQIKYAYTLLGISTVFLTLTFSIPDFFVLFVVCWHSLSFSVFILEHNSHKQYGSPVGKDEL